LKRRDFLVAGGVSFLSLCPSVPGKSFSPSLAACWKFDESSGTAVLDSAAQITDQITGQFKRVSGVAGNCLQSFEFDTVIVRKAAIAPRLNSAAFTIEAWIAPQTYPWNWCPIVTQRRGSKGYFFGVDGDGRFGLHVCIENVWYECNSRPPLPGLEPGYSWQSDRRVWEHVPDGESLPPRWTDRSNPVVPILKWSYLVGVFDSQQGITIFRNGRKEAQFDIVGKFTSAQDADLYIGRTPEKLLPAHAERLYGTAPIQFSWDGLIDEIRIHNRALNSNEITESYARTAPEVEQPLKFRKLPTGPTSPRSFGAYYTRLNYDKQYDRSWPVGPDADVVVTFDHHPFRLVYWHGMSYYPVWYSDNGIGVSHKAPESGGSKGSFEALNDRQCRSSQVRIIENNRARVKVQWRNAPLNRSYEEAHIDPATGWGDWVDDYYTTYPDGVAVRHYKIYCGQVNQRHGYGQALIIVPPGFAPLDALEVEAASEANLAGEESTLSWATGAPTGKRVANASIEVFNLKAKAKAFLIFSPETGAAGWEGNGLPWPFCFFHWDHWPAEQIPSDGRQSFVIDGRPSHTSIDNPEFHIRPTNEGRSGVTYTFTALVGMCEGKSAGQLAPLARSWLSPPALKISAGFANEGYSLEERCFVLRRDNPSSNLLECTIQCCQKSPLINPAFRVKNWDPQAIEVLIDGRRLEADSDFRFDRRDAEENPELIVWLQCEVDNPVSLIIRET
jgi:hypothetical protein